MDKEKKLPEIKMYCTMFNLSSSTKGDKRERELGIPIVDANGIGSGEYYTIPAYGSRTIDISGPEL